MFKWLGGHRTAVVVLHEIYGVNAFIRGVCVQYYREGYDVFCPSFYAEGQVYSYGEVELAYGRFTKTVGFEVYKEIEVLVAALKRTYKTVLVAGFSVGAAVAWRCSESGFCDGILCCYGSRIRDCLELQPKCPVLAVFASRDSFDVPWVAAKLALKERVRVAVLEGIHGFLDAYGPHFSQPGFLEYRNMQKQFFIDCTEESHKQV